MNEKEDFMKIPLLDLKAQYGSIKDELDQKLREVIASQIFILGPEVEALEKEIAAYSQVNHAIGVSSGSDALIVSLMALDIRWEDMVITTPFTFFATGGAIVRVGAKPVFCDINARSFNLDPDKLEAVLEGLKKRGELSRAKAILPVHLYGQCADMTPIMLLAKKFRLAVVEDAAQAIGVDYPSPFGIQKAGSVGDLGTLSFYPSKNLSAFGDAGMVLTNREDLAQKVRLLRVHGEKQRYYYETIGGNFRLDAIQAAVLRIKLKHLETWQEERRKRALYYDRKFEETGLSKKGLLQTPVALYKDSGARNYHTYHQYVVRAKKRDDLQAWLKDKQIGTSIYYPLSLHLQKCFAGLAYKEGDFPESEKAAREVLALPVYPELTTDQQDYVVNSIQEFYKK